MITAAIIVNPSAGRQNARAIAQQTACVLESQIDVGRVGEHIFLCMVGVGYDAKVVQGVARIRNHIFPVLYRVWADGLYLLSGCLALLRPSTTSLTLSINDEGSLSLSELDSVVVCNTRS